MAGHFKIVVCVTVFARADLRGIGRDIQNRFVVAQQAFDPAFAVADIHRQDFFPKAVVVFVAAIVQFADRIDPMTLAHELMTPTDGLSLVGLSVGPAAVLVHVLSGGKGRPRGHTDR